jgi:hypothetical protein
MELALHGSQVRLALADHLTLAHSLRGRGKALFDIG